VDEAVLEHTSRTVSFDREATYGVVLHGDVPEMGSGVTGNNNAVVGSGRIAVAQDHVMGMSTDFHGGHCIVGRPARGFLKGEARHSDCACEECRQHFDFVLKTAYSDTKHKRYNPARIV